MQRGRWWSVQRRGHPTRGWNGTRKKETERYWVQFKQYVFFVVGQRTRFSKKNISMDCAFNRSTNQWRVLRSSQPIRLRPNTKQELQEPQQHQIFHWRKPHSTIAGPKTLNGPWSNRAKKVERIWLRDTFFLFVPKFVFCHMWSRNILMVRGLHIFISLWLVCLWLWTGWVIGAWERTPTDWFSGIRQIKV